MSNIKAMKEIREASKKRMRLIIFGDLVTNICAGDNNPNKFGYFIRCRNGLAQCTDKKGNFWNTDITVIYPGHVGKNDCKTLFAPVWSAEYE